MNISILHQFADSLQAKFSLIGTASPEDQLKSPVAELMRTAGADYGLNVESRTETHLTQYKVRPDIAIHVDKLICGYIELKAPGAGADAPRLKGTHNRDQWKKLKALPNLIYSDGREWALYREGVRKGPIVSLDDDPTERGKHSVSKTNSQALGVLLRDFLSWKPIVPHKPKLLAQFLAPLTRFLRLEVKAALADPSSAATLLATEWRQYFFPEADDNQFADAYAQTVTYAFLLARLSGAQDLSPAVAATQLDEKNGVLAVALDRLGQKKAREELRVGFELLQRSLLALNPDKLLETGPDVWLYFYEDFLAAYDPKLRSNYGVYYTPRAVVEAQVRLVSELLETRFGKTIGFADDGVVFLDPAVGTGTYPIAAIKHALNKVDVRYGSGLVPARAAHMARNMYGIEVLIGPYAVAHLRLTQALESQGVMLEEKLNIYLADTLDSPNVAPPGQLTLTYKALTKEHEAARRLKSENEILVCIGNPPYDRQQIEEGDASTQRKGGWVRFGDQIKGGASQEEQGERAILKDFTDPAIKAGASIHIKNLYNDYVYFWRWALWRLFEQQSCGGIISFITASSYLAGPGFIGMREVMRRTFDHIWIIDLGGDNLGARKTPNVFDIQTPVAIAIGVRGSVAQPETPATVRYAKVDGTTRVAKLEKLDNIESLASLEWRHCSSAWHSRFLPEGNGEFFEWPLLTDLFPWQHSGVQFKRSWPIGETVELLDRRLDRLAKSSIKERKTLFRETNYRKIDRKYRGFSREPLLMVSQLTEKKELPRPQRYCYRQFDRQCALIDNRFGDRMRPPLISVIGEKNIFFSSLLTKVMGKGAAIGVSADVPDLHVFCGRGGKDIFPLYRDGSGTDPNVTRGVIDALSSDYCREISVEDFAAYVYALLGGQSYTRRFWNELETPGPRVPITKDREVFERTAALGRQLIWLHTYSERFQGENRDDKVPVGTAKCTVPISDDLASYPTSFEWNDTEKAIRVGKGTFCPVGEAVWNFEVSGLNVVHSWLSYRMKKRAGRRSSPLDEIRPERWTARMSEELLELIWILEATLAMEPELEHALNAAVAGPCYAVSELPQPEPDERDAPVATGEPLELLELMVADSDKV